MKANMKRKLYIFPSFVKGFSRVLDLGATRTKVKPLKKTPERQDLEAISSDWWKVGDDLRRALYEHRR
ncbi:hypothetical protein HMP0721_1272 [Pseudoramibacter alactolyticus ATCC 23263]|uniref:Uncharacterized protein n=1 Tax=Pseudoramibacter alactolyticus ATCC 23263 TaxID=887929 RepID=E6MGY8_9FIRM|nr:hypothetical protein HMP0721_1272 [Pseudoramibacter alactolyticus ATCC 23263]